MEFKEKHNKNKEKKIANKGTATLFGISNQKPIVEMELDVIHGIQKWVKWIDLLKRIQLLLLILLQIGCQCKGWYL